MLPRSHRLSRETIEKSGGRRISFAYGSLRILSHTPARAAVVVSKKTARTSVSRHRMKRRFQALLRAYYQTRPQAPGVIMYPSASSGAAGHAALKEALFSALDRA